MKPGKGGVRVNAFRTGATGYDAPARTLVALGYGLVCHLCFAAGGER